MSGFSTPDGSAASAQPPKQISNRLLNMKFMQRAAAITSQKSATTSSTPSSEPQPKRRRTGDFSTTVNNINSPTTPTYSDRTAISGALAAEADSSSIRRGTNHFDLTGEETQWILNVRIPVITNGHTSTINGSYESEGDSDEDEEQDEIWSSTAPRGRQTYGSFDKKKQQHKTANAESGTGTGTTPSSEKSSKKRSRLDDFDEDLSSLSSSASDGSSDGEIDDTPRPRKKKGIFDFQSEADLKRMDSFDFQKGGAGNGLGRQRYGLSGGGGGGGKGTTASPGHGHNYGHDRRKKMRKTM